MITQNKHIGLYQTQEEFEADKDNLKSPYVACIVNGEAYDIRYSTDPIISDIHSSDMMKEFEKIKGEKIYLTVSEYEAVIGDKTKTHPATSVDGTVSYIQYDPTKLYFTYEPEE